MLLEGNVDPSTTEDEYDERSHFWAAENGYEGVFRILPELNDFNPNTDEDEYT